MPTDPDPSADLPATLRKLRERRLQQQATFKAEGRRRKNPNAADRPAILAKTGGRCHICGGDILDAEWEADHVLAHASGGGSNVENFLPAHELCNNYRWNYLPEEFQTIMKLGVFARTQVARETTLGRELLQQFSRYDTARVRRGSTERKPVRPLAVMTVDEVRAEIATFDVRYKRDWRTWTDTLAARPLIHPDAVAMCHAILSKWQAVRSKTKGRTLRPLRASVEDGVPCLDEVIARAVPHVETLGTATVRDVPTLDESQRRALTALWDTFRDLPTIGTANAVGITKAVKLVTSGRFGPALDSQVRETVGCKEPKTAAQWLAVLERVAEDIQGFETGNRCQLEDLVEVEWQPVAVGRAYDMVFGPKG